MENIIKNSNLKNINIISAYLLNKAILTKYPNAKIGKIGVKENGFYSDIDFGDKVISSLELREINNILKKFSKNIEEITFEKVSLNDALEIFNDNEYKISEITSTEKKYINIIRIGNYKDIIQNEFINSDIINMFNVVTELFNVSSAYWDNDASNKALSRITGIAFDSQEKLKEYKQQLEEAKMRDHRKIGKDLELFMTDDVAQGMPFWLPNGLIVYNKLVEFWRKIHEKNGYQEIKTPIIMSESLWHTSGHWDHYKENMYTTNVGDTPYALKPMNCPGCMMIFKNKQHSYKEFPMRYAELGQVHRHEASGTLNGLFRVRTFTQDDAHIFCLPNQIESEIINLMELIDSVYKLFGFTYTVELSTRPINSMGTDEEWKLAETSLKNALAISNIPYELNEGDGAFYGPKIDFHIKDCLGREWQCGTIQLDFQMPERFDLTYIDETGKKHRPVMLHRVILGSIERFIGILTEQFKGVYPLWLSPTQVNIIPVTNDSDLIEYAHYINDELLNNDIRTQLDDRNEKLGYKMRQGIIRKIPITFVLGEKEMENQTISYRGLLEPNTYNTNKDEAISLIKKLSKNPADNFVKRKI